MHPLILGAGLAAGWAACAAAWAACPAAQAPVQEHFLSADCPACWAAPPAPGGPRRGSWRLDWISPTGPDAPLAAAALPDAPERLQRLGRAPATAEPWPTVARRPARPLAGVRLSVESGPAWQGYFGLQWRLRASAGHHLPPGSTGWMALVEELPAGSEGTDQPRSLVRSVAGPLPLDALAPGRPLQHLRALRWPESAQPTRLRARAWLEAPDGRVLAMAADRCP